MFNQAAAVTLRILVFRAGPQDFPHSPRLVAPMPAIAASAYFVFWCTILPPAASALIGLAGVGSLALVTQLLLGARGAGNRFQQTYHALLAATAVLALLMLAPMSAMAPAMKQLLADPELLKKPGAVQVPVLASYAGNALELWAFAVFAHVYRHALDTQLLVGALVALFVVFNVLLLTILTAVVFGGMVG